MPDSPLDTHVATPRELKARLDAQRGRSPFLVFRDALDQQVIVDLGDAADRATIGRRPGNAVCLEWNSQVSRLHAALERVGGDWTVVDDGLSHNGTYVNGARIDGRQRLRDGDVIGVGGTSIAFCTPGGDSSSAPTVTTTGPRIEEQLSPAQRRVLVALCRPFKDSTYSTPATNQQIADELVVGVDAVKSNLRALFELFGIGELPQNQKRATLALRALRTGVVTRRDL